MRIQLTEDFAEYEATTSGETLKETRGQLHAKETRPKAKPKAKPKPGSYEEVRVGLSDWAKVDLDVAEWARNYRWYKKEGYAIRFDDEERSIMMHREIMKATPDRKVWHLNGDRLDNRRENLDLTVNLSRYNQERTRRAALRASSRSSRKKKRRSKH